MNKIKQFIKHYGSEEMDSEGARELIEFAIGNISFKKDIKNVLCVGFGSGTELRLFQQAGFKVSGIDYNKKQVEKMKKEFDVKKGDLHNLKFKDNSFDLVFMRDVFEHSVAPIVAFSEACRVSRKFVYITLPDETWALSMAHTIIPTLEQMIVWGIKFDYSLDWFNERYHSSGDMIFKESYYIFRRKYADGL